MTKFAKRFFYQIWCFFHLPFVSYPPRCRFAVPVVPEWVGLSTSDASKRTRHKALNCTLFFVQSLKKLSANIRKAVVSQGLNRLWLPRVRACAPQNIQALRLLRSALSLCPFRLLLLSSFLLFCLIDGKFNEVCTFYFVNCLVLHKL